MAKVFTVVLWEGTIRERERERHVKMAWGISGIWAVAALGVSPGLEQMTLVKGAVQCA